MMGLRDRLGASGPGLVVAVIAVILALGGAAFAAGGGLTGKEKNEVKKIATKIAKKVPGKPGAPGAAGAAGTAGPQGPAGPDGAKGDKGDQGPPGKSVTVTPIASGNPSECAEQGGALVKQEGAASGVKVCNGEKGEEGSPWTAGGTLPPEKTETGAWLVQGTEADESGIFTAISFPIPLAFEEVGPEEFTSGLDEDHVVFVEGVAFPEEGFNPECAPEGEGFEVVGSAREPHADPGYLCVFLGGEGLIHTTFKAIEIISEGRSAFDGGTNTAGARLSFTAPDGVAFASGTFAVTAP